MGPRRGQRGTREQSAAPSSFSSFDTLIDNLSSQVPHTQRRGNAFTSVGHLFGRRLHTGRFCFRTTEGTGGLRLAHMFSRCRGSNSRSRSSCERVWADAKTAVGGGGSFGKKAHQLSIGLLREEASAGFAQVGIQTTPVQ